MEETSSGETTSLFLSPEKAGLESQHCGSPGRLLGPAQRKYWEEHKSQYEQISFHLHSISPKGENRIFCFYSGDEKTELQKDETILIVICLLKTKAYRCSHYKKQYCELFMN